MENSIFETDFYPTPYAVIARMMMNENPSGKVILEPSAGSGNIVDWLKENGAKEVLACETNNALRAILSRKFQLIGSDFLDLTAEEISHIHMIVMNPPFSADEKHILHAWAIAPAGCQIIALCNSNTLGNIFSRSRKVLAEIIQANGFSEELGECFSTAERTTNVSVSLVKLFKPGKEEEEFTGFFMSEEEEDDFYDGKPGLIRYNFVRDVVGRYVDAVSRFDGVIAAANEINELTAFIGGSNVKFGAYNESGKNYSTITRDYFKKQLQKESWKFIFGKLDMHKYVTSGVMGTINKFIEEQVNVPFTMKNIYHMRDMIVQTHGERMNRVLVEAFDLICSFSSDNSTAGETWKTNANYMVNRKFIVPWICDYDTRWPTDYLKLSYGTNRNNIDDATKALCNLVGIEYDYSQMSLYALTNTKKNWGEWYNFHFFRVKGYKKGTMHFEFLDETVWMNFNRKVAEYKGWQLPDNVRKGKK